MPQYFGKTKRENLSGLLFFKVNTKKKRGNVTFNSYSFTDSPPPTLPPPPPPKKKKQYPLCLLYVYKIIGAISTLKSTTGRGNVTFRNADYLIGLKLSCHTF